MTTELPKLIKLSKKAQKLAKSIYTETQKESVDAETLYKLINESIKLHSEVVLINWKRKP